MKRNIVTILLFAFFSSTSFAGVLTDTIWERVANKLNIEPEILYSVSLKEARMLYKAGTVRPHPWTIRNAAGPQLDIGQRLEYIRSVPYWHEVQ